MFYTSLINEAAFSFQAQAFVIQTKQTNDICHAVRIRKNESKTMSSHCESSHFSSWWIFSHSGNLEGQPSDSEMTYKRCLHLDVVSFEDIAELQQCYARYCCFHSYLHIFLDHIFSAFHYMRFIFSTFWRVFLGLKTNRCRIFEILNLVKFWTTVPSLGRFAS